MKIIPVGWDDPASVKLRKAQRDEVARSYGAANTEPGTATPTGDDIAVFLVAFDGDEAVGCGGLRPLDANHGEVKRMYVTPDHRGTGVSTSILRALEVEARERGWQRLVLETGHLLPAAIRFYEREGYTGIPPFGPYTDSPYSLCFEKLLG